MTIHTSETPYERDGRSVVQEEFVARHSGHGVVLTKYVVERKQAASPESDPCFGTSSEPAFGL